MTSEKSEKIAEIYQKFSEADEDINIQLSQSLYDWLKLPEKTTFDLSPIQLAIDSDKLVVALQDQIYQCVEYGADPAEVLNDFIEHKPIGNFYYWEAIIESLEKAQDIVEARKEFSIRKSPPVIYSEIDIGKMNGEYLGELISNRLGQDLAVKLAKKGHCIAPKTHLSAPDAKTNQDKRYELPSSSASSSSSSMSSSSFSEKLTPTDTDIKSLADDFKSFVMEASEIPEIDTDSVIKSPSPDRYFEVKDRKQEDKKYYVRDGLTGKYHHLLFYSQDPKNQGTKVRDLEQEPEAGEELEEILSTESIRIPTKPVRR